VNRGVEMVSLGEIADIRYGKGLRETLRTVTGKVPVFGSAGVVGNHDVALTTSEVIIVGRKGNAGRVFSSDRPCWPIDTVYYFDVPAGFDRHYLELYLAHLKLGSLDSSTAVPSLRSADLSSVPIPAIPIDEQRRIVAIAEEHFSHLDAAKSSLRKVETLAQNLCEQRYSMILKGRYERVRLGDIARTSSGGTPSRRNSANYGGSIPWIKSGELGDRVVQSTDECITETALASSSAKLFPRGTLLMAMYGATIGRLGIVGMESAATNQAVCAIQPNDPDLTPYLWVCLRAMRSSIISSGKGGAQPNISQGIIKELSIPLPAAEERHVIVSDLERDVNAMVRLETAAHLQAIRALALREAILHRLFARETLA
jgi:type I restriction enzyme, S subunit